MPVEAGSKRRGESLGLQLWCGQCRSRVRSCTVRMRPGWRGGVPPAGAERDARRPLAGLVFNRQASAGCRGAGTLAVPASADQVDHLDPDLALALTTPDKAASVILIDQNGSFPIARDLSMLLMAWALAVAGRWR